jgi:cobalamin synthase
MKNNFTEKIITICLILLGILLLNPFHFWMPDMMLYSALAALLVLFGIFAGLVMREKSVDERDSVHKAMAGRNAFLYGATALLLGIVVEGFTSTVDPWLIIALIVMVLSKVITRAWADKHL